MRGEVYFGILCSWCSIGKMRLTTALAGRDDVGVVWRSLELAPEGSPTAGPTATEMIAQYQSRREAADTVARQLLFDLGHPLSRLRRHPLDRTTRRNQCHTRNRSPPGRSSPTRRSC
jgi:hypothetical protein